jgi:hypothetical protein
MLFDLKGRRKRFIQVTYVALAFLFAVGLVGFGIGGGTSGGIFDALKGNGGGGAGSSIYTDQAKRARAQVRADPKNERAWLKLSQAELNVARTNAGFDQTTGQFTKDATDELERSTQAWERYLQLKPKKPDPIVAQTMVQAYSSLLQLNPASVLETLRKAARAQELAVKGKPNPNGYFILARINYFLGRFGRGDAAGRKALAGTPRDQRNTIRAQLKDDRDQGQKAQRASLKQKKKAEKDARTAIKQGQDPFGAQPGQAPAGP